MRTSSFVLGISGFRQIAFIALVFYFCDIQVAHSQSSLQVVQQLTTREGLSSDKVEAILQDHEGFYWIATQNGLNRYDGTSFKVFRSREGDSTALTHNFCTSLVEDAGGDIWISTFKGVSRYLRKKGCFQQLFFHHPSKNFEVANNIRSLTLDDNGNLWIAGGGLWCYNIQSQDLRLFLADPDKQGAISGNQNVQKIIFDAVHEGLWINISNEINFYEHKSKRFYSSAYNPLGWKIFNYHSITSPVLDAASCLLFVDKEKKVLTRFNPDENSIGIEGGAVSYDVRKLVLDSNQKLWICDWNLGADVIDLKTHTSATGFFRSFHPSSVEAERVNSLYVDNQDNYWIGSDAGIRIFGVSESYYHQYTFVSKEVNPGSPIITAIAQAEAGYLWIGCGGHVYHYALSGGRYDEVPLKGKIQYVSALYPDKQYLWIGADDKLIRFDTRQGTSVQKSIPSSSIYFIHKSDPHLLWVGTWQSGLYRFDEQTLESTHLDIQSEPLSLHYNYLVGSYMDSSALWLGYNGGNGFSKLSLRDQQITHFNPVQEGALNTNGGTITAIAHGQDKSIWLGTFGGGIFHYDPLTQTYKNYGQEEGLKSNYINSMLADSLGNLWISTPDGMNYFDIAQQAITSLPVDLVFSGNEVVSNGMKGVDGKLYFFCKDVIVEIDPKRYHSTQDVPRLVISSFKVFGNELPFTADQPDIQLSYAQNFFSFEFSALKKYPDTGLRYGYKLNGFDPEWIDAGTKNFAGYTNVPAGHYQFQVRTKNETGPWSPVLLTIPIGITPPFWRTWWFFSAAFLTIALLLYAIYRYRVAQIKKIFTLRSKISQDLHDEVGSALSSIHLFSTVASRSLEANPVVVKNALNNIHQNSRNVMEKMSDMIWAIHTGKAGENTLEQRLKNYGYELLSPLDIRCEYQVDPGLENMLQHIETRKNVLLIIKEAMNNIAKYSGATDSQVRLKIRDGFLEIAISDNGRGFTPSAKKDGHGIGSMQRRTEELKGKFSIQSSPGQGTTVNCYIPIPSFRGRRIHNQA